MASTPRRFRKPDLMTSLTLTVAIAMAITLLLPYF